MIGSERTMNFSTFPALTVVVPVYNEASIIQTSVRRLCDALTSPHVEIIVVDDGSIDTTAKLLQELEKEYPSLRAVYNHKHRGKGFALKTAIQHASKDIVCFLDCDLPVPLETLPFLIHEVVDGADAVIASRFIVGGDAQARFPRTLMSAIFRFLRKLIVGMPGIQDTQCGCKIFTRTSLSAISSKSFVDGFCFDVELLYLYQKHGRVTKEVPVSIARREKEKSIFSNALSSFGMLRDLFRIRFAHG